jgi:hypothetical protein
MASQRSATAHSLLEHMRWDDSDPCIEKHARVAPSEVEFHPPIRDLDDRIEVLPYLGVRRSDGGIA